MGRVTMFPRTIRSTPQLTLWEDGKNGLRIKKNRCAVCTCPPNDAGRDRRSHFLNHIIIIIIMISKFDHSPKIKANRRHRRRLIKQKCHHECESMLLLSSHDSCMVLDCVVSSFGRDGCLCRDNAMVVNFYLPHHHYYFPSRDERKTNQV
jgi:hypothetical protein